MIICANYRLSASWRTSISCTRALRRRSAPAYLHNIRYQLHPHAFRGNYLESFFRTIPSVQVRGRNHYFHKLW